MYIFVPDVYGDGMFIETSPKPASEHVALLGLPPFDLDAVYLRRAQSC